MHKARPPFACTSGPRDAKIVLVGEAHGDQEQLTGMPFIGASGQELTRLLTEAGLNRSELLLTNTFAMRPGEDSNSIGLLTCKKAELPSGYSLPPVKQGQYVRPEFLAEVDRLKLELDFAPRNLVVALGAVACWALLRNSSISSIRGATTLGTLSPLKVLPTFHPSYLIRGMWQQRPIVVADLMKAKVEGLFPEIRRPERTVLVRPTLAEISAWAAETLAKPPTVLGCDIETEKGQISMIGFARSASEALVIPFIDRGQSDRSYWRTHAEEKRALDIAEDLLSSPIPKVFQNGAFDIQYLWQMGLRLRGLDEDTMLLHHSMYPELLKGLGFLGSVYTNESSWKLLRNEGEELKRDE